jgi:hypothetical protein
MKFVAQTFTSDVTLDFNVLVNTTLTHDQWIAHG